MPDTKSLPRLQVTALRRAVVTREAPVIIDGAEVCAVLGWSVHQLKIAVARGKIECVMYRSQQVRELFLQTPQGQETLRKDLKISPPKSKAYEPPAVRDARYSGGTGAQVVQGTPAALAALSAK